MAALPACQSHPPATQYAGIDTTRYNTVGKNIPIPSQFASLPLVEPHISAHPSNNNHLLVTAMVVTDISRPYESCRLSSFVSTDAGQSWKGTAHDWWGYDSWTAILPNGKHYLGITAKPDNSFQLVWSDSRSGVFQLQTCNVTVTE